METETLNEALGSINHERFYVWLFLNYRIRFCDFQNLCYVSRCEVLIEFLLDEISFQESN